MDAEIVNFNKLASEQLACGQLKKAFSLLQRGSMLISDLTSEKVRVFTLVNLSTCLARLKSYLKASENLASLLSKVQDIWLRICILINLAAVKSKLGYLEEALEIDIKALKDLKGAPPGINKATIEACLCRNIAVICMAVNEKDKAKKYDLHAQEVAMAGLGPSSLLTIALQRSLVLSSHKFIRKVDERFLKKVRFITGERLQPMSGKRTAWTKRLKILHLSQEGAENDIKSLEKIKDPTPTSTPIPKAGKSERRYKAIKIINHKDLALHQEKQRAALVIQKNFRMFSARRKYLLFKNIGKKVEIRMDGFDIFSSRLRSVDEEEEF